MEIMIIHLLALLRSKKYFDRKDNNFIYRNENYFSKIIEYY